MTRALPDPLFSSLSAYVAEKLGLCFPAGRTSDLRRGIESAAREFGFEDTEACVGWLLSTPLSVEQVEVLAGNLTVGETYFFREKKAFKVLEERVLPELVRLRRGGEQRLRLWSAACCTGEEAFSLAISVRRALPDLADWRVTILGTDINPRFLSKASLGVYGDWSFRETPPGFRDEHFTRRNDGRWEILPEIRKMVEFRSLNLAADAYPSLLNGTNAMDVVFCRNVLIYFAPDSAGRVIRGMAHSLSEGGWLFLGPNDASQNKVPDLVARRFSGTVLFQKDSLRSQPDEAGYGDMEIEEASPPSFEFGSGIVPPPAHDFVPQAVEAASSVNFKPASEYDEALALYGEGRYSEAAHMLAESVSAEAAEPRVMALQARILANQGLLAAALSCCDRLVAGDKLNPEGRYLRGSVLLELGSLDDALQEFRKALYLDQDFVLAHFALGSLARTRGRHSESDRHFAAALSLAGRLPHETLLPEADGLTAGRLVEIVTSLRQAQAVA